MAGLLVKNDAGDGGKEDRRMDGAMHLGLFLGAAAGSQAVAFTTRFAVFHLRHWRMASPSSSGIIIAFNVSFMSVNVALMFCGEAGTRTPQQWKVSG